MASEIIEGHAIDGEHMAQAQKILDAAEEYFSWRRKNGLHGAVVWLQNNDNGRLIVFTRGEYRTAIQDAVCSCDGRLAVWNDADSRTNEGDTA